MASTDDHWLSQRLMDALDTKSWESSGGMTAAACQPTRSQPLASLPQQGSAFSPVTTAPCLVPGSHQQQQQPAAQPRVAGGCGRDRSPYVLALPAPHPAVSIVLEGHWARSYFEAVRARAEELGDPLAVRKMYELLAPAVQQRGLPLALLRSQLAAEFGSNPEEVAAQYWSWARQHSPSKNSGEALVRPMQPAALQRVLQLLEQAGRRAGGQLPPGSPAAKAAGEAAAPGSMRGRLPPRSPAVAVLASPGSTRTAQPPASPAVVVVGSPGSARKAQLQPHRSPFLAAAARLGSLIKAQLPGSPHVASASQAGSPGTSSQRQWASCDAPAPAAAAADTRGRGRKQLAFDALVGAVAQHQADAGGAKVPRDNTAGRLPLSYRNW